MALGVTVFVTAGTFLAGLTFLLQGEAEHSCICPLDSAGHCECVACDLLEIHGPRRNIQRSQASTVSGCTERERGTLFEVSVDPMVVAAPASRVPAPHSTVESSAADSPLAEPDRPRLERPPRRPTHA